MKLTTVADAREGISASWKFQEPMRRAFASGNKMDTWKQVRIFYERITPSIFEHRGSFVFDVYESALCANMTPIEEEAWYASLCHGLTFYPQFPVGPYFADMADPHINLAIECDGFRWHQNKAKDAARDDDFARMGWRVIRIPGWKCKDADCHNLNLNEVRQLFETGDDESAVKLIKEWLGTTVDGVMASISCVLYGRTPMNETMLSLMSESLDIMATAKAK